MLFREDFSPLEQPWQKCSSPAPNTAGILPLSTQTCQNTSVSKSHTSTINTTNFHAWLGCSPQPDRDKPSTCSQPRTRGIKSSLTGAGKNEQERKAEFQFSRWDESGSVTHMSARACWEVEQVEFDCVAPRAVTRLPVSAKPHLFPLHIIFHRWGI